MNRAQLQHEVARGEDSRRQFKADVTNPDSLAAELVAFSNSDGGVIYVGVADNGTITGLKSSDIQRLDQLIGNAASQHVRSPVAVQTENVDCGNGHLVIVLTVPAGMDKPYFDRNGVIWIKNGADKRRLHSKEELRRLFQDVDLLHADEVPTQCQVKALDRIRFRDFLKAAYSTELPDRDADVLQLLENLNLARDGRLNLAGLLLFGEKPSVWKPAFVTKAVAYPGTTVSVNEYLDSEDFDGPLKAQFEGAIAFITRNLQKPQRGQGVNTVGRSEIPRIVFEELIVNALVHRDYFISAPIRVFLFADRIEIISPGHLPNHLTVERMKVGISNIRNPIIVSFISKGLLPYRGLGSGIRRAIEAWPRITFADDREGCTFTATIQRVKVQGEPARDVKLQGKDAVPSHQGRVKVHGKGARAPINAPIHAPLNTVQVQLLTLLRQDATASYDALATALNKDRTTIMRNIQKLKSGGVLIRVGSKKLGRWRISEPPTS